MDMELEVTHIECQCFSPDHTLRFMYDEEDNSLYTDVFLYQYHNIFKRIWLAIKYVFGQRSGYGHFDCWLLNPTDAVKLKAILDKVIERANNPH